MTALRAEAWSLLQDVTESLVEDPASDVVWAGEYEGRWGVRMAQQVRDFTTIWFDAGDRTLGYEAYVLPAPPSGRPEVYRQALVRNRSGWRTHFALDGDGDLYLRGRMPLDQVDRESVDEVLGAIYEQIELAFRPLVRAAFPTREKTR